MPLELLTRRDLNDFKQELFIELQQLFSQSPNAPHALLKSREVLKILRISPGTLQNLRKNQTLPFTKGGGTLYYRYEDVARLCGKIKG